MIFETFICMINWGTPSTFYIITLFKKNNYIMLETSMYVIFDFNLYVVLNLIMLKSSNITVVAHLCHICEPELK